MFNDDRLLIQYQEHLLELSKNLIWCPRCHQSIICPISESQSGNHPSFAQCFHCQFAFCRRCEETWHPQLRCPKEDRFQSLLDPTVPSSSSSRHPLNPNEVKKILMEIDTAQIIEQCSKPCPSCQVRIEKNGGCSHMHCRACQVHFCWICGWFDKTYGFHHCHPKVEYGANANASLALTSEIREKVEKMFISPQTQSVPLPKALARRVQRCPRENCGRVQVKTGRTNLMFCPNCQLSFCFVCGENVYGDFHFSPYACEKFSDVPSGGD